MTSLSVALTRMFEEAFARLSYPIEHAVVTTSGQAETAQYQCNGALKLTKIVQKNPREIAQSIIDDLSARDDVMTKIAALSIGGPGFINIVLRDSYINQFLCESASHADFALGGEAAGECVVLDYGGPNIAKAMHVGHLRSSIIGDTLRRMYRAAGARVLADVHMGDWGTPMGMLIADYLEEGFDLTRFDITNPKDISHLMADMADRYPKAANKFKENEEFKSSSMNCTVRLQVGEEPHYTMWKIMRDVSINAIRENFARLDVHFDLWKGEADAHPFIAPMVEKLRAQGLAVESDGALVVPVAREDDKKEMPPLILYKRDGAVLYGTTDLATIVQRVSDYNPNHVIYIVDQRQSLHFEQVFRAAYLSGIAPQGCDLIHAGFGTMNGSDGKPFKTRAGGVMKLEDLIAMAIEKAVARLDEAELARDMDEAERADVAYKVAIAAIKFADLQNNRIADYVFDIDRMTSFEGKTGPYLLYQAVRIQSLLRKAEFDAAQEVNTLDIRDEDRALALLLAELPAHFGNALRLNAPHVLCDYVYKLAQEFSSFYGNCHILSESDAALRASRLALCALTLRQLTLVLGLLGIQIPVRM